MREQKCVQLREQQHMLIQPVAHLLSILQFEQSLPMAQGLRPSGFARSALRSRSGVDLLLTASACYPFLLKTMASSLPGMFKALPPAGDETTFRDTSRGCADDHEPHAAGLRAQAANFTQEF